MTVVKQLAAFAAGPVRLPRDVTHMAKQIIANAISLALASWQTEPASIAFSIVENFRTPQHATVWGRKERVGAGWAALLNGIAVHFEDYDDTHMRTLLHPGPVIVPAACAIMEYCGASSERLLEGVVLGTEVAMRIGNGIRPAHYERGWHVTSTMGRIGASIAAARVLGLSAEQTRNALAIAALETGGVTAALGTMTKPFHPGKAAFDGIEAARLAQLGIAGAQDAIEGAFGLAALTSDHVDIEAIQDGLGEHWEILTNSFKPYSCGLVSHPIIDAAIVLRTRVVPENIVHIDIIAHPLVLELMGKEDPQDGLESKFSAYHCAAIGFLYGAGGPQQFSDACVRESAVRDLRGKIAIAVTADVAVGAARMSVRDRDGRIESVDIPHATGSIENPMSPSQLEAKARALLGERFVQLRLQLAAYGITMASSPG
ncbi:MAG: MmgE/PrpD family protein [Vulcanimicrobiaceae bacterium]